ncbi:hypothetical protein KCP70_03340 [Salmonella enterica subsp. enterica]|nr:hypothetical protein KCP70_03340 [Salmonella enterica subsp. enterica]
MARWLCAPSDLKWEQWSFVRDGMIVRSNHRTSSPFAPNQLGETSPNLYLFSAISSTFCHFFSIFRPVLLSIP